MQYCFKSSITEENGSKIISIPFNVWEICDNKDNLPVEITITSDSDISEDFSCDLISKDKGKYNIPISESLYETFGNSDLEISFHILNKKSHFDGYTSPYSSSNPIRIIDSMKLIKQPHDGLCGQTCIAMLADITLEEACEIMHCSDWQANMCKIIDTLDYLYLSHTHKLIYTQGENVELPKCAILLEKMGRYSHYLIYFDGTFYDPTTGILEDFDMKNLVGYLEIICN